LSNCCIPTTAGEFDRIVNEGLPLDRDLRIIQPNGRLRWLSSRTEVHLDKSGKPVHVSGVMLDITPHREMALAKTAADLRFKALVSASKAFVWTADPEGNILETRNWTELRGENPTELLGSRWIDLIHPDDRERTLQVWQAALEARHDYAIEHQIRQPDGSYRWLMSRAVPIITEAGTVREWVGISSDIHEAKAWPGASPNDEQVLTGPQIRAARAIVNWSVRELCESSGVSSSTIRRFEEMQGPPRGPEPALAPIRSALERAGVEFLFPPVGKPGARPA
jgi:PAS domain S-box-containing protein